MCHGQIKAHTDAQTRRCRRLDGRSNAARRARSLGRRSSLREIQPRASCMSRKAPCGCRSCRTLERKPSSPCSKGGHFFGEGCLAGQLQRMATATAMTPCTIVAVEKQEMVRQLQARARVRGSFPDAHADEEHPNRRRSDRPALQFHREAAGTHASCCSRDTVNPRRLTAPFRACLRSSWPRWSARHGRVSTSS